MTSILSSRHMFQQNLILWLILRLMVPRTLEENFPSQCSFFCNAANRCSHPSFKRRSGRRNIIDIIPSLRTCSYVYRGFLLEPAVKILLTGSSGRISGKKESSRGSPLPYDINPARATSTSQIMNLPSRTKGLEWLNWKEGTIRRTTRF